MFLTYHEVAERFGITRDAAKILSRRKGWPKQPPNRRGGAVRVGVPDNFPGPGQGDKGDAGNAPTTVPGHIATDRSLVPPYVPPDVPAQGDLVPMSMHKEVIGTLQAQVEMLRADIATQQARHDAEMARQSAERDAQHREHVERILAQAATERSLWLERVDSAELRAERVEQRLDQVLDVLLNRQGQSWWSKLFGTSKRSDLG